MFEKRLREVFLEEPSLDFLPYNEPNSGGHSRLKRHYKDEPFVFYLRHRANVRSELKEDEHYHRTDHPCKTVPGFVLRGEAKDVTALKTQITAEICIIKKERTKITKTNLQFPRFLKEHIMNISDGELRKKTLSLLVEYNKWLICYFNPQVFGPIEDSIFKSVFTEDRFTRFDFERTKSVLEKLKWNVDGRNLSFISRDQIIRLFDECIGFDKGYIFSKNDSDSNGYADRFIKALQSVLDPLTDFDRGKLLVNLSISTPNERERFQKIIELMASVGINITPENHVQVSSVIWNLLIWEPMPHFDIDFNIGKEPCPACYSQYSEPYPSLPYNHDNVVCLYNKDHPFYHRIDDSCKKISYEEEKHVFREELKEAQIRILKPGFVYEARLTGKKPCGHCWWELDLIVEHGQIGAKNSLPEINLATTTLMQKEQQLGLPPKSILMAVERGCNKRSRTEPDALKNTSSKKRIFFSQLIFSGYGSENTIDKPISTKLTTTVFSYDDLKTHVLIGLNQEFYLQHFSSENRLYLNMTAAEQEEFVEQTVKKYYQECLKLTDELMRRQDLLQLISEYIFANNKISFFERINNEMQGLLGEEGNDIFQQNNKFIEKLIRENELRWGEIKKISMACESVGAYRPKYCQ